MTLPSINTPVSSSIRNADLKSIVERSSATVKHKRKNATQDDLFEIIVEQRLQHFKQETLLLCFNESILPLTLAGCGQVLTGLFLDQMSENWFFTKIPVAFALITPLLNLKGNLEMNFASRIATCCHTGEIKTNGDLLNLSCINHGLSQSQTISISALITLLWTMFNFSMSINNIVIFISSVIATASAASFTIETFLIGVIILARHCRVNPDNVGTPIAATVGDISTLGFYVLLGNIFMSLCPERFCFASLATILLPMALIPFYIRLASSHPSTRRALTAGWLPLFLATVISSGGGFVLKKANDNFRGYATIQPIIVGLVGNMCGIQASRLSSGLHVRHKKNELQLGAYPRGDLWSTLNPVPTFFGEGIHSQVALMMIGVALPSQLTFAFIVLWLSGNGDVFGVGFCVGYLFCVFILITLFMYFCQLFVHLLWRYHHDPDYSVIPLLTALCDCIGSMLLLAVFAVLNGEEYLDVDKTARATSTFIMF